MVEFIIRRKWKLLFHLGILMNDSTVAHFASSSCNFMNRDQTIKISSVEEFSMDRNTVRVAIPLAVHDVAHSRIETFRKGQSKYNFFTNNCITFVIFCAYGRRCTLFEMIEFIFRTIILT